MSLKLNLVFDEPALITELRLGGGEGFVNCVFLIVDSPEFRSGLFVCGATRNCFYALTMEFLAATIGLVRFGDCLQLGSECSYR